jgi:hypothetical protein
MREAMRTKERRPAHFVIERAFRVRLIILVHGTMVLASRVSHLRNYLP